MELFHSRDFLTRWIWSQLKDLSFLCPPNSVEYMPFSLSSVCMSLAEDNLRVCLIRNCGMRKEYLHLLNLINNYGGRKSNTLRLSYNDFMFILIPMQSTSVMNLAVL